MACEDAGCHSKYLLTRQIFHFYEKNQTGGKIRYLMQYQLQDQRKVFEFYIVSFLACLAPFFVVDSDIITLNDSLQGYIFLDFDKTKAQTVLAQANCYFRRTEFAARFDVGLWIAAFVISFYAIRLSATKHSVQSLSEHVKEKGKILKLIFMYAIAFCVFYFYISGTISVVSLRKLKQGNCSMGHAWFGIFIMNYGLCFCALSFIVVLKSFRTILTLDRP